MRLTRALSCLLVCALLIGGVGCLASGPPATVAEVEDAIVRLVNEERTASGLAALARDSHLDALAEEYAASGFSDTARQSNELRNLLSNSWSVKYGGRGPLLGGDTAREQVTYCLGRTSMRDAMLRPEARETGIGVVVDGDTVFYSQAFDFINAAGGDGQPIRLNENAQAVNPSWTDLKRFLKADNTDEVAYRSDAFVCSDFAELLHNDAETAGIKAAYVSVSFADGPGHALNAFMVGNGIIFIDVIGGDKVAYVEEGQRYGIIALDVAEGFSYSYFETYARRVEQCRQDSDAYAQDCADYSAETAEYELAVAEYNKHPTPEEYERLCAWRERLEQWADDLDGWRTRVEAEEETLGMADEFWDPYGSLAGVADSTVVDFYVHW